MFENFDYYTTPKDSRCKADRGLQTNPRYTNFTQMYFTAGDPEQFWEQRHFSASASTPCLKNVKKYRSIPQESGIFKGKEVFIPFDGYKNLSQSQVEDTFKYIFHKFKKGIYVKICENKLISFIPFSNATYANEWSDLMKVDPKYDSFENFFKHHNTITNKLNGTNYRLDLRKISADTSKWYANNCILRYENPINEEGNNYPQLKSMFLELCKEREIPDAEFFLNKRDFPLLTRNGTEPYTAIYGDDTPLKSFRYDKYLPILSMCTSDGHADLACPTHEDWARVKSVENVYFPYKCTSYNYKFNHEWKTKLQKAVFRGSNTGCGYDEATNIRLKLAKLGTIRPDLLDVGISNWNTRIRKHKDSPYLQIPQPPQNVGLVPRLTPEQQSNYKYIIHLDGHVAAFRLSLEMSMGSCILVVKSGWKLWFSDLLEEGVHYLGVKEDLSDLVEKVEWCVTHDKECKQISKNALNFFNTYLSKTAILDYLQTLITQMTSYTGILEPIADPIIRQYEEEYRNLFRSNQGVEYMLTGGFPKNVGRNYGVLKGFQMFLKQALRPEDAVTLVGVQVSQLFKSKTTTVKLLQVGGEYLVSKTTDKPVKKLEFTHEAFLGIHVLNQLVKLCPHFVFTYMIREEPHTTIKNTKEYALLQEYVRGPTLQQFLAKGCSFKVYLEILLQISIALKIAQAYCEFVHHDLKPWNIMIDILPEPIILEYPAFVSAGGEKTIKIKTRYIPVMVDYGKSHAILKNVHYGILDPFSTDRFVDLYTILVSTLTTLGADQNTDPADVWYLANFLAKPSAPIQNASQLARFVSRNKQLRPRELRASGKQLDDKSIDDFLEYVNPLVKKHKISFGNAPAESALDKWTSNSRQLMDMGFSIELEQKVESYRKVCSRLYRNAMPQATNRLVTFMIAQRVYSGINTPKLEFLEFAQTESLNPKLAQSVLSMFQKAEDFITTFYNNLLAKKTREPLKLAYYPEVLKFDLLDEGLTPSLLVDAHKIKSIISSTSYTQLPTQFPDYLYYKHLIEEIFAHRGLFRISQADKQFYQNQLKNALNPAYIRKVADIATFKKYAQHSTLNTQ